MSHELSEYSLVNEIIFAPSICGSTVLALIEMITSVFITFPDLVICECCFLIFLGKEHFISWVLSLVSACMTVLLSTRTFCECYINNVVFKYSCIL